MVLQRDYYPQLDTPIDAVVFGGHDPKEEWYANMNAVVNELKRLEGLCLFIRFGGKEPSKSDMNMIVNAALKFHSSDVYYSALEGSEVIDSGYVGGLVYDVIDHHIPVYDVAEILFGGNVMLKDEFVKLKSRSYVSTSGCIRYIVPN